MTRISASIKPVELCDKMLMAEHREIIRIPNTIKTGKAKVNLNKISNNFKLGTGHVTFFYNKLEYLHKRYNLLYLECKKRGFNVQNYNNCFEGLPENLYNNWSEDINTRKIVIERINTRLETMKTIKYYSKNIELNKIKLK